MLRVIKYQTEDGKFFDTEQDAVWHEKTLAIAADLKNLHVHMPNVDLQALAEALCLAYTMEKRHV